MTTKAPAGPWKFRRLGGNPRVPGLVLETLHRPVRLNDPVLFAIREDWVNYLLVMPEGKAITAMVEAAPSLLAALVRAEEFLVGFEDDEAQNIGDLLAEVRGAIALAKGENEKESGHG
jgi:hypothetical protein